MKTALLTAAVFGRVRTRLQRRLCGKTWKAKNRTGRAVNGVLQSRQNVVPDFIADYTSEHLERLFGLQFADKGKRFEFLRFVAFKEEGCISICEKLHLNESETERDFEEFKRLSSNIYGGQHRSNHAKPQAPRDEKQHAHRKNKSSPQAPSFPQVCALL